MAKASGNLGPEPPFVGLSTSSTGSGNGLAGEPAADEVDVEGSGDPIAVVESIVLPVDLGDVAQVGDVRPVFLQDFGRVGVSL
jgi:hypothetical protein